MPADVKVDIISDALRQRILDGDFGTAGRLPSLRMLAEQMNTTHETINKVIQRLQAEGLLVSYGRAGVFVSPPRTRIPGITSRFDLHLQAQGIVPFEANIDKPMVVPAPPDVAASMGISSEAPVVRRYRIQGGGSTPYRLAENFYPISLVGDIILETMQKDEHFDVLLAIKEGHSQSIKRVHEDVIGRLPTSREQALLKIVRSAPVLEVRRTNFAEDDITVILFSRIVFVASYFILSYDYIAPHWSAVKEQM